jgi:tetratricopeptide (TPR) repeat protein
MAAGQIEILGGDVFGSIAGGGREGRFPLAEATPKLQGWAQRYDRACERDDEGELAAIGREMFDWLDGKGWASAWADALGGDRILEIKVGARLGENETALLNAPWELIARADGPLALDAIQLFVVARRVGAQAAPLAPRHADLELMFMAAAPQGQRELDFEAEEAAILKATQRLPLRLVVEETGNREFLGERLNSDEGPFEALHLSCHGDIDPKEGPVLLLETPEGGLDTAKPGALIAALGADPPPLVFLSACRTAEFGRPGRAPFDSARDGEARRDAGAARCPQTAAPFAQQMAARIPNVVGWDGSVYDADASAFATHFYRELAGRSSVPRAAAVARRELLRTNMETRERGRHWHLARVYCGPRGGGALCAPGGKRRHWDARRGEKAFLDKEKQRVPVATPQEFVGRRRAIQAVLRAFRDGRQAVLIHGMGALGKSSLAARVMSRMPSHAPVVIFERYDTLAVFDSLLAALDPRLQTAEKAAWRDEVKADPAALGLALQSWLDGPLDLKPVLLILDDLERILETPKQSDAPTGVAKDYRDALDALLSAFDRALTRSRLIVTSRYDFALPDGRGGDWAASLVRVALRPMEPRERIKQWRALAGAAGLDDERAALLSRAIEAASGNPGLQAILTRPILAGEIEAARNALDAVDVYRKTGAPPAEIEALIESGAAKDSDNALIRFFARVSFSTYRDALTEDQARQLTAATLFSPEVPIPLEALGAAGQAHGVEKPQPAIARLLRLGLLDDWGAIGGVLGAAANPLARPLAPTLDEADIPRLARAALPELARAWRDREGDFPFDPRGLEAARLALAAEAQPDLLEAAVLMGAAWLERVQGETRAAHALIAAAMGAFPEGYAFGPDFLRLALECANTLGDADLIKAALAAPVRPPPPGDPKARSAHAAFDLRRAELLIQFGDLAQAEALTREAQAALRAAGDDRGAAVASDEIANILESRGEVDEALRILREEAAPVFDRIGDARGRAQTMGKIADILESRGEVDEALRIRREEELPVYDRIGDARSRAVTMGKIADILMRRGEADEALRIRREEQLPVYERIGDARERALTMGKIADILVSSGELDEALRIRREEELPVYERIGDARERAVAMGGIADILERRGEVDEALRIRREEELPVYERIGDARSRAVTMVIIADILMRRGEVDEALGILRDEAVPIFERIGDAHARAVTMGKIADILESRGEVDEALRIRREEQLPVFERIGDARSRAVTMGGIADILERRGEVDEALRIRREEELPVYERIGDARSRAETMGQIADILMRRDEVDEALRIFQDEVAPVFQRIGDARSRAVTMGRIADILQSRGEVDEALRIRREEELPVYERIGDAREPAVAMGKIADILESGGEVDEALRIRREEQLPVFDRIGDAREKSAALYKIASALLESGGLESGRAREIADALAESYAIALKLGHPDIVGASGALLAQVLAMGGHRDDALAVLDQAEAAFAKLGNAGRVAQVKELREAIKGS